MNTGIFLNHEIDAFTAGDSFVSTLQNKFREHNFTFFSSVEQLETSLADCDLLITWQFKKAWYQKAVRLRAIFTPAAGKDWIEQDETRHIPAIHGTFHGPLMAETLCGMIIYFNKHFGQLQRNQREHLWDRNFMGSTRQLFGQIVMIYGYGSIGRECSRVLKTFGCKILGVRHSPEEPFLDRHADRILTPEQSREFLGQVDHLVSILPGTKMNDHIFGREFWSALNPSCYFYNIGRGNCCSEKDLLWALDNKKIAGAGLDVFEIEPLPRESALWDHPNVFITPHASAISQSYLPLYLTELIRQLTPFLQ